MHQTSNIDQIKEMEDILTIGQIINNNCTKILHESLEAVVDLSEKQFQVDYDIQVNSVENRGAEIFRTVNTKKGKIKHIEKVIGYSTLEIRELEAFSNMVLEVISAKIEYYDGSKYVGLVDSNYKPYLIGIHITPDGEKTLKLDEGYLHGVPIWIETTKSVEAIIAWLIARAEEGYLSKTGVHILFTLANAFSGPHREKLNQDSFNAYLSDQVFKCLKGSVIKPLENNSFLNEFMISLDDFSLNKKDWKFSLDLVKNGEESIYQSINYYDLKDLATTVADFYDDNQKVLFDLKTVASVINNTPSAEFLHEGVSGLLESLKLPKSAKVYIDSIDELDQAQFYAKRDAEAALEECPHIRFEYLISSHSGKGQEFITSYSQYVDVMKKAANWKGLYLWIYLRNNESKEYYSGFLCSGSNIHKTVKRIFGVK